MTSDTLEYRGYVGSVLYSAADRLLYGSLLGIRDSVSYEGVEIGSLERDFHEAVDDYLQFCVELGKAPNVPTAITPHVKLGDDLAWKLARFAESHKTHSEAVVEKALTKYLAHAH